MPPLADPPAHLSERAKQLWREVVSHDTPPGRLALIQTALEALDRADECREAIRTGGLTTITEKTGAVHINPLLKIEKDNRALFAKIWRELGLHVKKIVNFI